MNDKIERIKKTRIFLIDQVSDLSVEHFNEIPLGFNNNIIWNLAHLTAAQQGMSYVSAGQKPVVNEKYLLPYKSGTKPLQNIPADEIEIIIKLLLSSLDIFKNDYENKIFSNYISWKTRYGVEISNIDNAIEFLMYHEGLHCGYIMALKRLIKK